MTPFRALRTYCGLSNREAAEFLRVKTETVDNWNRGRSTPPCSVMDEMMALADAIRDRADAILAEIVAADIDRVEIACPDASLPDGAMLALAGMILVESDANLRFVEAGSTIATKAARETGNAR